MKHLPGFCKFACVLAAVLSTPLAVLAGLPPSTQPTTQLGANDPAAEPAAGISELIKRLGSDNAQDRDAAQASLASMGFAAGPALKEAADNADDPEIRSRAAVVLSLLKNRTVSKGSLITLHANQMSPQEVFREISEQTHSHIEAMGMGLPTQQRPGRTVTLDADQQPFWDVMNAICTQLNVCPSLNFNGQNAMRLMPAWENWMAHAPHDIVGPYWISMSSLTHSRTANFNGSNPLRDEFGGQLIFLPEPRLTLTEISDFKVTEATDDAGHSLMPRPRPMGAPDSPMHRVDWFNRMLQFSLTYPEQPGSKISLLRGEVMAMVAEDIQQYQMDDVLGAPKVINPLEGSDLQVHVSRHESDIRVDVQAARGTCDPDKWSAFENSMNDMTLLDSGGHAFMLTHPPTITMSSESIAASSFKAFATFTSNVPGILNQPATAPAPPTPMPRDPQRLIWKFPTSFKAVKIPVTFKDLQMP